MTAATPQRTRPRPPALDRGTAYRLAATEYQRFLALMRDLGPSEWSAAIERWMGRAHDGRARARHG